MKVFAIALAAAGLAVTAPLSAQIVSGGRVPPPVSSRTSTTANNGSWYSVGRDANGYNIYERQTRDAYGRTVIQRARRDANGNMTIISTRTVNNGNVNQNDCTYNRTTNGVGDIIFGRTGNTTNCEDRNRDDGGWYQVGRGANNNSIYERRVRDRNGNLVIQRARRNSNGTFTILNTRRYSDSDKEWRKEQKQQDKEWRKQQKEREKEYKKAHKGNSGYKGNRD